MPGPYNTKKYRKNMKTLTYADGGTDQIPMAGPFNEIIWSIKGTTDAHTLHGAGQGIARVFRRVVITSNKRGTLADFDSMIMLQLSRAFYNVGYEVDTVGGSAVDGVGGIIPIGVDADELITMTVTFGALAEMGTDLAGYTGVLRTEVAVINSPLAELYWAFRKQVIGASGVIGATATWQQPTPPVIPGFYMTGELFLTFTTDEQTAIVMALEECRVTQSDDYLIDDYVVLLQIAWNRRIYNNLTTVLLTRHIPVVTSDVTQVTLVNGAVATIAPSEMCYIYVGGKIASGQGASEYRGETEQPIPQTATPMGGAGTPIQPNEPYVGANTPGKKAKDSSSAYRSDAKVNFFNRRG